MQAAHRKPAPRARKTAAAIEAAIEAAYKADNADVAARLKVIIEKLTGVDEHAQWLGPDIMPRGGSRAAG